ncbi:flagellar assembly protein FliX [Pelagibacterium limicola]|uniref:flagellar assembly protein FliX n=1 Tax=Pelagibacterium limicola TaxID=2791022 RepID=UPI0018AFE317|nr:flagellar assembly protein FliX [Pelagibacterium limicola]
MRIDGTGRIIPGVGRGTGHASRSGEAFRPEAPATQARAQQTSMTAASTGIDALLALQAVDDATTGRRKAVKRANLLLDALEEIRADLLGGRVNEGRLNRAVALLGQAKGAIEPELEALVADIELRVRVELAKLGRYPPL